MGNWKLGKMGTEGQGRKGKLHEAAMSEPASEISASVPTPNVCSNPKIFLGFQVLAGRLSAVKIVN
jgi:hypothetical protein